MLEVPAYRFVHICMPINIYICNYTAVTHIYNNLRRWDLIMAVTHIYNNLQRWDLIMAVTHIYNNLRRWDLHNYVPHELINPFMYSSCLKFIDKSVKEVI